MHRFKNARVGAFKPIADFDWKHPTKIDRHLVTELFLSWAPWARWGEHRSGTEEASRRSRER
ncbi:MAG: hypothetical protein R3A51_02150 [Nannocystaceae bacterium]|nr:hypothetical protein [Myxococcales bacterium]